jgi:long-chain acyl-CoA synthetase
MLYDRWRQTAREHPDDIALIDAASGRRWTFRHLAETVERESHLSRQPVFPQGHGPEFIIAVLQGWRGGAVVCPLEPGQSRPSFGELPPGCVHLKITSASMGMPRVVAFTAEQLAADAENILTTMRLRPDWPNLSVISLAHSYGFSNLVLPLLLSGIPLILADSPFPETVRRAARLAPALTLPAVPALWRNWLDAGAIPANVRLAISAGAPLPLPLEEETAAQCGLKLHNFYGASECGGIAYDRTDEPRKDANAVGSPMENVQIQIDGDGCLVVHSGAVGLTYWPEPSVHLAQGRFRSSDLARIQDGLVSLRGRQGDQINVAGRKVLPENIERVLARHPMVRDCLVFGAPSPDQDRSEMIVACVAARSGVAVDELRKHLLQHLPAWQVPRDWWFLPELRANGRGKLARHDWRQRYLLKGADRARPGHGS